MKSLLPLLFALVVLEDSAMSKPNVDTYFTANA